MKNLFYLLLFSICFNVNAQDPAIVTKKVMIVRVYGELLSLPNRVRGEGDFMADYISLYPTKPGELKIIVSGSQVDQMKISRVFAWDLNRSNYRSILREYNITLRGTPPEVLQELSRPPETQTYYLLNEKPRTIQMWTADALCQKYMKQENGKITDSIFLVKSLKNLQPLDDFVDDSFCSVQWTSIKK